MNHTVTIAIASFNNAKYIERCINSVLDQTYFYLDVLIVDDGSTDDTIQRIQKYFKDERVRFIQKKNGGLSSVRQLALDEARGQYICFIDADDYLMPTYIDKMLNKLLADNSDICVCSSVFVTESGERLESSSFLCEETIIPVKTTASEFEIINNPRIKNIYLSDSWNKLYMTDFLRKSGVKFNMPKGLNGTDTLFNRMVAFHAPSYSVVQDELYIHVIYSKSAVHRKKKDLFSSFRIITQESILESRKLGIYEYTKGFIETKYSSNFVGVLIDESKDIGAYFPLLKRFNELKNKHLYFAKEYGLNTSQMGRYCRLVDRIILFTFYRTTFLLPILLGLGKRINKLL